MSRPSKKGMFGALPVTDPSRELRGSRPDPFFNEKHKSQKEKGALSRFISDELALVKKEASQCYESDSDDEYNDLVPALTIEY